MRADANLSGVKNTNALFLRGADFKLTASVTKNKTVTLSGLSGVYGTLNLPEEITIGVDIDSNSGGIIPADINWSGTVVLEWKNDKYLTPENIRSLLSTNTAPGASKEYYSWSTGIINGSTPSTLYDLFFGYGDSKFSIPGLNNHYYISNIVIPSSTPQNMAILLHKTSITGATSFAPARATMAIDTDRIDIEMSLSPSAIGKVVPSNIYTKLHNQSYYGWTNTDDGYEEIQSTNSSSPTEIRYAERGVTKSSSYKIDISDGGKILVNLVDLSNFGSDFNNLVGSTINQILPGNVPLANSAPGAMFPLTFTNSNTGGDGKTYFQCSTKMSCREVNFELGGV